MINNFSLQDQMDFNLVQVNVFKSISKRFIITRHVQFIHDSIFAYNLSNWEECLISRAITLAYNHSINGAYHD